MQHGEMQERVRTTDSYVAGVEVQMPCRASLLGSNQAQLSSSLTDSLTLSLSLCGSSRQAGTGLGTLDQVPREKKAETHPSAGLESGQESQPSGDAHHSLLVCWSGAEMLVKYNRVP